MEGNLRDKEAKKEGIIRVQSEALKGKTKGVVEKLNGGPKMHREDGGLGPQRDGGAEHTRRMGLRKLKATSKDVATRNWRTGVISGGDSFAAVSDILWSRRKTSGLSRGKRTRRLGRSRMICKLR